MPRGRQSKHGNAKHRTRHSALERIVDLIRRPPIALGTDTWTQFDMKKRDFQKARKMLEAEHHDALDRGTYLPPVLLDICQSYTSTIAELFEWIDWDPKKTMMALFWICRFFGGTHRDHPTVPPGFFERSPDQCGNDVCWVPDAFVCQIDCSHHKPIDNGHRLVPVNGATRLEFEKDFERLHTTTEIIATIWCDDRIAWFVTLNRRYLVDTHGMANLDLLPASPVRWITNAPTDELFDPSWALVMACS
jgi:hypothetical protein